jgi:hypothetical protein
MGAGVSGEASQEGNNPINCCGESLMMKPKEPTGTTQGGSGRAYAIDRLSRERPDLLKLVKAGKLSPHAAMVEAGFRPRSRSVTEGMSPEKVLDVLGDVFGGRGMHKKLKALTRLLMKRYNKDVLVVDGKVEFKDVKDVFRVQ